MSAEQHYLAISLSLNHQTFVQHVLLHVIYWYIFNEKLCLLITVVCDVSFRKRADERQNTLELHNPGNSEIIFCVIWCLFYSFQKLYMFYVMNSNIISYNKVLSVWFVKSDKICQDLISKSHSISHKKINELYFP